MSERAQFDNSALAVAAVAGILLIAGTVFFLPELYCKSPSATCPKGTFDVTWALHSEPEAKVHLADAVAAGDAMAKITHKVPGQIMAMVTACTDTRPGQQLGQAPAQITWTLTKTSANKTTQLGTDVFACSDVPAGGLMLFLNTTRAPDIATQEAGSPEEAAAAVWDAVASKNLNQTVTYTLHLQPARAGGTVPLPAGSPLDPSLSVDASVMVGTWTSSVAKHVKEVSK